MNRKLSLSVLSTETERGLWEHGEGGANSVWRGQEDFPKEVMSML